MLVTAFLVLAVLGPVQATVVKVYDGDTINVDAQIWVDQEVSVQVRIRGIDAPELFGECERERDQAQLARDHIAAILPQSIVLLYNVEHDKYAGRVIADVSNFDGLDLASDLLEAGLARAYDGGKRESWCEGNL